MSTQNYRNDEQTMIESKLQSQIRQQLGFTTPARDTVISQFPQTASLVKSSLSVILDRPAPGLVSRGSLYLRSEFVTVAEGIFLMQAAQRAIEAKANQLGWAGAVTGDIADAGTGYVIRYERADIYYSKGTGAHVVYGDIRAKYNLLGGANGVLGLPLTDETGTPDGIGRYNHFQGGSIYWTPTTGPMMVRGAIRDMWASQGWELGPFGYPVSDPDLKVLFDPINKPTEYASTFQKGAIYSKGNATAAALVAELSPQDLTNLVRKMFDKALKEADGDLGIEGGINVLDVSDWGFDFSKSRKRMITYEINGFYSNGIPLVADPTFQLRLQFLFDLTWNWQTFTEPVDKTLVIYLMSWRISTSGVGSGTLFDRLKAGIPSKFPFAVKTIPAEALLIDTLVTPQGGLQFLLEPDVDLPGFGNFRRDFFQGQLNLLVEE